MARGEWGNHNNNSSNNIHYNNGGRTKWWCTYKRMTIVVCGINILVALHIFHSFFNSYPSNYSQSSFRYNADQIRKIEESNWIRKASEPTRLMQLMNQTKKQLIGQERLIDLPQQTKQMITDEILLRLRGLEANASLTVQREAIERWRMDKVREAEVVLHKKTSSSSLSVVEAGHLLEALGSNWSSLFEELGFWIPVEIINTEHDDKPEDVEEPDQDILPGRLLPPECRAHHHTDYGGDAVKWGLTHHKESAYECCMACFHQAKHARPHEKKCNIWVYCPSEQGCHSPDIYEHKLGECWLKYSAKPRINFKYKYSASYRRGHQDAPLVVPWVSGLISA